MELGQVSTTQRGTAVGVWGGRWLLCASALAWGGEERSTRGPDGSTALCESPCAF